MFKSIRLERVLKIHKARIPLDDDTYKVIQTSNIVSRVNELVAYYGIKNIELKAVYEPDYWTDIVVIKLKSTKHDYLKFATDLLESFPNHISGIEF